MQDLDSSDTTPETKLYNTSFVNLDNVVSRNHETDISDLLILPELP